MFGNTVSKTLVSTLIGLSFTVNAVADSNDPTKSAAGPAGNPWQQSILDRMDENGDGCSLLLQEPANPEHSTYAPLNDAQLSSIMHISEDLDAMWAIIAPNRSFSYIKGITPASFKQALSAGLIRPLKSYGKTTFEKRVLQPYFVMATSCGKFLFYLDLVSCNYIPKIMVAYNRDTDIEIIESKDYKSYWTTNAGQSVQNEFIPVERTTSFNLIGSLIPDSWEFDYASKTLYYLSAKNYYPKTYSVRNIAEYIVSKKREKRAWALTDSLDLTLMGTELLPFGSVIRTIAAKGIYQYETFDLAADGQSLALDTAVDLVPVLGHVKKARTASKFFWAATVAGVSTQTSWNALSSGQPDITDLLRIVALTQISYDLKRLSKDELVADMAIGLREAKLAAARDPGIHNVVRWSSIRQKEGARSVYFKKNIAPTPRVADNDYDKVLLHIVGNDEALKSEMLSRLDFLQNLRVSLDSLKASPDTEVLVSLKGLQDELDGMNIRLITPGDADHPMKTPIIFDFEERTIVSYGNASIVNPALKSEEDKWRYAIRASIERKYESSMKLYGTANLNAAHPKGTVSITPLNFGTNTTDSPLSDVQLKVLQEEIHYFNRNTILEEIGHALGFAKDGVGVATKASAFHPQMYANKKYIPLTEDGFNFISWLDRASVDEIKQVLNDDKTWKGAEGAAKAMSEAAKRTVTPKELLVADFPEADVFFLFNKYDVPMTDMDIYERYPVRTLAARWFEGGKPQ